MLALAVLAPAAFVALEHRFEVVPLGDQDSEDSYDERGAYKAGGLPQCSMIIPSGSERTISL